jgi:hypothetical protein
LWRETYNFEAAKNPKKQTDAKQSEAFFDTMRIPPPHHCDFTIDLQQRWSINRKICDRHATFYLIVRGVTVAILLFFL